MSVPPAPAPRPLRGGAPGDPDGDGDQATVDRRRAGAWPIWAVIGWFTGMAFGQVVLAIALNVGGYTVQDEVDGRTPLANTLLATAGLWLGFIGVPWLATRPPRGRGMRQDLSLRVRAVDAWGLLAGVVCQLALVPAVSIPWVWALGRDIDELNDPAKD